jgi:hypothetical protein
MKSGGQGENDRATNVSQLRADIDSGETGDKIPFPDPAAAPLGTDDEAGGAPLKRDAVAAAAARETSRNTPTHAPDKTGPWVWAIIGAIVLVILAAAAALYWPAA